MTWNPENYDIGADETRVCYAHGKINVCRIDANCMWTTEPRKVEAVRGYQENRYDTWQVGGEWYPGMPCNRCFSKNTVWSSDPTDGAVCLSCGGYDSDE